MYNHNTAVQMREADDALNAALQRARKHVTPHGSLFVDKPNSSAGWKFVAKRPALPQPLALLASCLAEILELARKLIAPLGYNVSEEERESTFTSVSC